MKIHPYLVATFLSAALLSAADVRTAVLRHSLNTSVSNRDIITLAKSGYDEEFIIRIILGARCTCETTADALADMAEQGISQRVIEVMLDSSYRASALTSVPAVALPTPAVAVPMVPVSAPFAGEIVSPGRLVTLPSGGGRLVTSIDSAKTSAVATAVSGRVPMYEAMSAMWGIWRKKSAVANAPDPRLRPIVAPSGVLVNGSWQYLSVPLNEMAVPSALAGTYSGALGRFWHTAPYGGQMASVTWYPVAVPPVYTHYLVRR